MKILVVDDDPVIRGMLEEFLSLNGYHADCATNGLDALKCMEKDSYHLLIVDYQMPQMNGIAFVKEVRKKWVSLPIIAMSLSEMERPFLEAGADLFLPKPVDLRNLRREIESFGRSIF